MNVYVAHARILHKEPPKQPGRSGLMVLKVGRDKRASDALIQSVNQIIVRIPPHLTERAEKMAVDSYVEVFGHVGGIVRRSPVDGAQHLHAELVAANIQPAVLRDTGANPERQLFNRFIAIGLLRGVRQPEKAGPPVTAFVQIGPDRPDRGRALQHSGVISLAAYGRTAERLLKFEANAALHLEGRVIGLMRKVPKPGAEGGFEASLDAGLVLERAQPTALVAERLLQPIERDGDDRENRAQNESAASKEPRNDAASA